MTRIAE
jgi:E1A-binding protein p400